MYTFDTGRLRQSLRGGLAGIGANVFFLGLTSLLTDVSSEMVGAILPLYLVVVFGLSPMQFGVVDGLSQGLAALAPVAGGRLSDRWRRRRAVAGAGYAMSTASRLLLSLSGSCWGLAAVSIALDRVGKGIRTAPRDALISLAAAPARLGVAFGIHRAMDTAGALIGPLLSFAILARVPQAFDLVLATSFFVALAGLAALLCFVREPAVRTAASGTVHDEPATHVTATRSGAYACALPVVAAALGLFALSDSFFFLVIRDRRDASAASIALCYAAAAAVALVLAIPAGWVADRIGRVRVLLGGHFLLALGIAAMTWASASASALAIAIVSLGGFYACSDGVLMALASQRAAVDRRAGTLGSVVAAGCVARVAGSVLFGLIWQGRGVVVALAVFGSGLVVTTAACGWAMARLRIR